MGINASGGREFLLPWTYMHSSRTDGAQHIHSQHPEDQDVRRFFPLRTQRPTSPSSTRCDIKNPLFFNDHLSLNTPLHMVASSTPVLGPPGSATQIADLTVIHYEKLLRNDAAEAALLLSACADWGFFYLDLGGLSGGGY